MNEKDKKIAGFVINLFVPGVGTIISGKVTIGILQLFLGIVGWILCLTLIGLVFGIPLLMTAWLWALIAGAMNLGDK